MIDRLPAPRSTAPALLLACLLLGACAPSDGPPDAAPPRDAALDLGDGGDLDAAPDATPDAAPDAALDPTDARPDLSPTDRDPPPPACADTLDNDGDGRTDLFDPGCLDPLDDDEADPDPLPACGDTLDNDGDGRTDYPSDPDCAAAGAPSEGPRCGDTPVAELGPAGGRVRLDPIDAAPTHHPTCGQALRRASIIAITLDAPAHLRITAAADDADLLISVRRTCGDLDDEIACAPPGAPALRLDARPPGTYYVFVHWADPDRAPAPIDVDVLVQRAVTDCNDGRDNDLDGLTDLDDPGCIGPEDDEERQLGDALPACANDLDDDDDGRTDYPRDPDCRAAGDAAEAPLCPALDADIIEAGEGLHVFRGVIEPHEPSRAAGRCTGHDAERIHALVVDRPSALVIEPHHGPDRPALHLRPDCQSPTRELYCDARPPDRIDFERLEPGVYYLFVEATDHAPTAYEVRLQLTALPPTACQDTLDNDGDGRVDLDDPGCLDPRDDDEAPDHPGECTDGLDNDRDGRTDYPDDPDCAAAGDPIEAPRCAELPTIEVGPAGGVFAFDTDGASTTTGTCGGETAPEIVLALTLDHPARVVIESDDSSDVFHVRTACDAPATELACASTRLSFGVFEPGTHFIFVELDDFVPAPSQITVDVFDLRRACADGLDNDADGRIDALDPGCTRADDDDETDPPTPPACANGLDDDRDGRADHPLDPDCTFAGGETETGHCPADWEVFEIGPDGGRFDLPFDVRGPLTQSRCNPFEQAREAIVALTLDTPADVTVSAADGERVTFSLRAACTPDADELACWRDTTTFEGLPPGLWYIVVQPGPPTQTTIHIDVEPTDRACADRLDNDGDGLVDLDDPGCESPLDDDERGPAGGACDNGLDDDGDGLADFPADPGCRAVGDGSEVLHCAGPWSVIEAGPTGGRFPVPAQGGVSMATAACAAGFEPGQRETVVALTLDEPADVYASALGRRVSLYARATCDDPATEFACEALTAFLELPALPAGTHYIFIDPDIAGPLEVDIDVVPRVPDCADGLDNDADGLTDADDPGCRDARDDDERDPQDPPACADGLDNDDDGATDYPHDPDCAGAGGLVEAPRCRADVPVYELGPDGGLVEIPRVQGPQAIATGCPIAADTRESVIAITLDAPSRVRVDVLDADDALNLSARTTCDDPATELICRGFVRTLTLPAADPGTLYVVVEPHGRSRARVAVTVERLVRRCNDHLDNDADGLTDADDPGCRGPFDDDELDPDPLPACADGLDNDGDGHTDYPDDPDCRAAGAPVEAPRCALDLPVIEVDQQGGIFDLPALPGAGLVQGACDPFAGSRETALAITLDRQSDLTVTLDGVGTLHARRTCDDPLSELGCAPFAQRLDLRDQPPGTLYVFVDPDAAADLVVRVEITSRITHCNDTLDNDDDGLIDLLDPGCATDRDDDETDPPDPPECADGLDNDDDGATDYPDDQQCLAAGAPREHPLCRAAPVVAELIDAGARVDTDTTARPDTIGLTCADGGRGGENVIAITLTAPAALSAQVIDADYDTALELRTACDDPATALACDDDGAPVARWSALAEPRLEPGRYFLIVDGFDTHRGRATVDVRVEPL